MHDSDFPRQIQDYSDYKPTDNLIAIHYCQ